MLDFNAIDFETANGYRSSVCSVGIVVVRGGKIVDNFYELIKPVPHYYNSFNTRIHGLTESDTSEARIFPFVWRDIMPLLGNFPLVAHNSRFDESCLKAVFDAYRLLYPGYRFLDTLAASRRTFGSTLPNHKLHTVAERCGFDLKNHHHALADAEACARIALQIL